MKFDLKPLSADGVAAALDRAKHYRLLNEPWEAESICRDILLVDDSHQEAAVVLLLALTDQLPRDGAETECRELIGRLSDGYQRSYYLGLLRERKAKAQMHMGVNPHVPYDGFRQAMDAYEQAIALAPSGNQDAVLRWNTCARIIMTQGLRAESTGHFKAYGD